MKRYFFLGFIINALLLSAIALCQTNKNISLNNSIKAYYTRLAFNDQGFTGKYADIVIDLNGKGEFADIVVNFENSPWRYVFWRGTRYLPSLVTDKNKNAIWSNDQSPEHYSGQCFEHMRYMQSRFSNIRLIHNSPARVIVLWRNASARIGYGWPKLNENGWGIWTDEYWSIYPDGIAVRHQIMHNGSNAKIIEMNQNEILMHPGPSPEAVLPDDEVTVGNVEGELQTFYRSQQTDSNHNKRLKTPKNLQYINFKSTAKQFEIGEPGTTIDVEIYKDVYWKGWNHYPIQLIQSDGTVVFQSDRPASMCPATFREVRHQLDSVTVEAMTLHGLTNRKPEGLNAISRFWNFAPELKSMTGCESKGFQKQERAYHIIRNEKTVQFSIAANDKQPLFNPVFIVSNWADNNTNFQLKLNGKLLMNRKEYQQGNELDTNGKPVKVI